MLTSVSIILLVLVVLLSVPIAVSFQLNWQGEFNNRFKLSWMFGLVRLDMSPQRAMFKTSNLETSGNTLKRATDTQKHKSLTRLILQKRFRQRIFRYVSDLWHSVQKENLIVRIRAGLDDPADTGQLWAVVGPVAGVLRGIQQHSIELEPDFLSSGFELYSSGDLRFSPLRVVLISIGLLFSPSVWNGFRHLNAGR